MNDTNLTTFYIVRHGQTDWNNKHLLQGQTDIPLNETGEKQAKELAQVLENVNFDLAFSSDLLRAKRTAEIIVLEKRLHVAVTTALRERDFGTLEGQPVTALLAHIELLKTLNNEQRRKHRMSEGVENDEEVTTRLLTFLRETAVTHQGKNVLVATHGGIIRILLLHTGYFTYEKSDSVSVENGGYVYLQSDGVDFFVKEVTGVNPRKQF